MLTHMATSPERRWRILWISEQDHLAIFTQFRNLRALCIPQLANIPGECKVVDIHHSWERRQWGLRLEHPSFDPVPDGTITPDLEDKFSIVWKMYRIVTDEEKNEASIVKAGDEVEPEVVATAAPHDNPFVKYQGLI